MGTLYFIQAGEGGPIKIGISSDVRRRMVAMQTDNHTPLILRGQVVTDAPKNLETELHGRFAEHRIQGEWFAPAAELLLYIDGLTWTPEQQRMAAMCACVAAIAQTPVDYSLVYAVGRDPSIMSCA